MRPKSLLLLVLALGCGLVASIGINQVMANRRAPAPAATETTPIFVAMRDVPMGDILKTEMLKLEEWPVDKVPPGAIGKLEDLEDRRARAKFYPGEPILEAKLFAKGETGGSATDQVPVGMRVVAVRGDSVSAAGDLLLPGDRVDVLVFLQANQAKGINQTSTQTILQNVKVFAINSVYTRTGEEEAGMQAKTVSLLVTPEQAELLTVAAELGSIRLVMRSVKDNEQTETAGVTVSDMIALARGGKSFASSNDTQSPSALDIGRGLLGMLNAEANKPATAPAEPEPTPAPAVETWSMRLLIGSESRKVMFQNGEPMDDGSGGAFNPFASAAPYAAPANATPEPEPEPAVDNPLIRG